MKSQPRSPSELAFGSLLVYAPQGTSEQSTQSKQVVRHIKNCRSDHIRHVGLRFAEQVEEGRFGDFLGPDAVLVPVPRRSPTVKDMLWPALAICTELQTRGLCGGVERLLERHSPVPKSALLSKGADRPSPERHQASLRCPEALPISPARITLVDDVVTRGSTLLGCAWVLQARFPDVPIRALAVVRTMSRQDVEELLAPVDNGRISLGTGAPHREP